METENMEEMQVSAVQEPEIPEPEITAPQEPAPAEEGYSRFEEHIRGLEAQAAAMAEDFPGFSLEKELQDPVFLQLTAPGTGISVADAYYALHRQQIQERAQRQAREQVVSAIQSGARRPMEAGTDSQSPSTLSFRYDNATKDQREAFKKELRRAWGRGETVYPR